MNFNLRNKIESKLAEFGVLKFGISSRGLEGQYLLETYPVLTQEQRLAISDLCPAGTAFFFAGLNDQLPLPGFEETLQKAVDPVAHPPHYNSGKIEVLEAIEDWKLNFNRGNAVKYIARAGRKDATKEIEDLEKAIWYLRREKELAQAKAQGRAPCRPNEMGK